jgi:hypothetical protein
VAQHRIVCTDQEPIYQPTTHAHIVAVGTGTDPNKADQRLTLQQVLDAMDRGDVFYTVGVTSGKVARVEKYTCTRCWRTHIRSTPDAVTDNNLDNLRRCSWQS